MMVGVYSLCVLLGVIVVILVCWEEFDGFDFCEFMVCSVLKCLDNLGDLWVDM